MKATELFVLTRQAFMQALQTSPDLLSTVLENLTRTVRASTEHVLQQRLEQRTWRTQMELAHHRALTEMVAGVAHEINTPLGIVRTAASVIRNRLASGAGGTQDVVDASTLIERNIERAHRLVEEFKSLSMSQVTDVRQKLDLVRIVNEVVELYAITARDAGLRIRISDRMTAPDSDRIWLGYRGRLSQVLLNLLNNIERYAYPDHVGGMVDIVVAAVAGEGFTVAVRDEGRGIAPDDLPRVFEPFFTTGRAQGGSGLGLAIVYNLMRDGLGGRVEIASQLAVGTTVTLHLPRMAPE
jgi:signal transduction histidine kinase